MTVLFPLFLAGAAAVVAPILLHLRRQPPKTKVEFSSLQFLSPTPLVTTTRSKIERWLLLALRCLALLLLAVMFARPFTSSQETTSSQGKAVLLLIDRSASMQQGDQWPRALAKAKEWINRLSPQDQAALGSFDRKLERVASFTQWAAHSSGERQASLTGLNCSWAATDLGRALVDAVTWINEAPRTSERTIVVISDFQDGSNLEALRGFAWPEHVQLLTETIPPKNTNNLSLSLVAGSPESDDTDAQKATSMLRVRVANARDSHAEDFLLKWSDGPLAAEGHLPPGATRVLRIPRPTGSIAQTLTLTGDEWTFDNVLHIAPPQPRVVKVVTVSGKGNDDSVDSPLFYLKRALVPTSKLSPEMQRWTDATSLQKAAWVMASNAADPSATQPLRSWVEQGGRLLCVATDTQTGFLNGLLQDHIQLTEANVKDYALLSEIDFSHPLLKPFQDARLRDFTKIHVWHHRSFSADQLKPEVVARFDNGQPAWLSLALGKGRIVILLSGWQPKDSQLALSSKFVPLLYGMLEEAGVSLEQPAQFLVGDSLPTGDSSKPGFVKLSDERTVAVNLAPEESRISPMGLSKLTALGVKLQSTETAPEAKADHERLANEEVEARQQYWLIVLAMLLWVLGTETWLAGRKGRSGTLEAA